jgi:hypothetical protein
MIFLFFFLTADLSQIEKLSDPKLNGTQRANVCFALRGNSDPEVVRAMRREMEDRELVSCAAENLRIVKAVAALEDALRSENEQARAAAARELGTFEDPALLEPLSKAAHDPNALVASNALLALTVYHDPGVVPYLSALSKDGGMIGDMALERLLTLDAKGALGIARKLIGSSQVPDKLYAIRTMGAAGDRADLAVLRKIASANEVEPVQRARGFGLMPPINLSRAALAAIEDIETRSH